MMKKYCLVFVLFLLLSPVLEQQAASQPSFLYFPLIFRDYCPPLAMVFLAFGDSITQCFLDSNRCSYPQCGYPERLNERMISRLHQNYGYYNVGLGGERTSDGLSRFANTLTVPQNYNLCPLFCSSCSGGNFYPPSCPLSQPDLVIIMEGVNDLGDWAAQGSPTFEVIEGNLRTMVLTALQNGRQVIIATLNPVVPLNEHRALQAQGIADFNLRILQIANDFQIPVADIYSAFLNYPDWENNLMSTEFSGDGIHPNDLGFEVMAEVFYQTILSHLRLSK
jgi:lysophospholipase L1-like esterase